MKRILDESELNLESGRLCLEFANTADWHARAEPVETLHEYSDLIAWAERVGLVSGEEAQALAREALRDPEQAANVLAWGIELREAIYRVLVAASRGEAADPLDLKILNRGISQASARAHLMPDGEGYTWVWSEEGPALESLLWPVARATADVLTPGDLLRVGQCADDRGCGWLFFDTSRNRSRRWCDMRGCGNRAKARRHYNRTHRGKGENEQVLTTQP